MLTTRDYVRRPIHMTMRLEIAIACAKTAAKECGEPVTIELKNRRNPNGLTVRAVPGEPTKVRRFICLAWARKNGYVS